MWEKTVTLLPGNRLRSKPRLEVVIDIITAFEPCHVDSVQFGYDNIRVAFETPQGRTEALKKSSVEVCREKIKIDGGGSPILAVVLFDYPFEDPMEPVIEALGDFGDFKSFRFQKYPYEDMDIYTGSRLIRMTLHEEVDELPRYITIGGYHWWLSARKRSLSEGSSSGSAPSDGAGAVSYASVVKVQISPPPSQRRRRFNPAVNVERSRSRSVSRGNVSDSVDSLVSPNDVLLWLCL